MAEGLFGIHGAALQVRSHRLGLLSSNIANAATPGYKARDIDFRTALDAQLNGADSKTALNGAERYRKPLMPSMDGNTVELGSEQVAFAETATGYATTLSFIQSRVETLTRALRGE
jgi:flagellar basal-body rod protein FlgB